jgi:hypothetical protein
VSRPILVALLALACGGGSSRRAEPPPERPPIVYSPDVPAWRGGCFANGPAGKIVNGQPSHDVRVVGTPCGAPGGGAPGPGALVYLDAFDPIAGTGDVTVLPSGAGARPVVVGARGGTGGIVPGDTGVRLDAAGTALLTLAEVGFVSGTLVRVDVATGAPVVTPVAADVRVLNYEFLPGGEVLYVTAYSPATREGDLALWSGGASTTLVRRISRAEFELFRLDPARRRAAYLLGWTETAGGDLQVLPVSPAGAAELVDRGVERVAWTGAGALVWDVRQPNGNLTLRRSAAGAAFDARTLATDVRSWTIVGDDVVYVGGWSLLAGSGTLGAAIAEENRPALADGVLAEVGAARAANGLALAAVEPGTGDRRSGSLRVGAADALAAVDDRVAPRAGFSFSPDGALVAYARDWSDPSASGSASPQPGIAGEVRVVQVAGGAPVTIAARGSMQRIAWDPVGRLVAAVAELDPASNSGRLEVRRAADGGLLHAFERASPFGFAFGAGGDELAALRGWDDALGRGELVLQRIGSADGPVVVSPDVTAFLAPSGGRMIYVVRGGGRDGLWLH